MVYHLQVLRLSVWRKTHKTFSKMKIIYNLVRCTMSGEYLEDLMVLAALTAFELQRKVERFP